MAVSIGPEHGTVGPQQVKEAAKEAVLGVGFGAFFTDADEPYEKLQRALRADIDEAAWQILYSTMSR